MLVLEADIALDSTLVGPDEPLPPAPHANPVFDGMMDLAIEFFEGVVQGRAPADEQAD